MPTRLTVEGLSAVRGGRPVFAGRSFALSSGQLLAVTGPNGAGKSTLLRIVAGLLRPEAGTIQLDPVGEGGLPAATHYLGHMDALKVSLTVRANLSFWRTLWSGTDIEPALDAVGLGHVLDLPAGALSAGQKRRVALARLLIHRRPLWLLDEPATALDDRAEAMLGDIIAAHLASGGMAIVATHRPLPVGPTGTLSLGAVA